MKGIPMRFVAKLAAAAVALVAVCGVAEAKEWKKVRVGTEGAYPPFNFLDSNKQVQGFEIDYAKELCKKMKVECEFIVQDWDGIIPALLAGKYDAIIASMSITEEREKQIAFSDYYYTTPASFITSKKTPMKDTSPVGLKGKTIGAQSSTIHSAYLEDKYKDATIKLYGTQDEANLDLANGRLDAVLADKVVLGEWLNGKDGTCCAFTGSDIKIGTGVGVGLRKDDKDLKTLFNKAIAESVADGTFKKINDKYFPFPLR